VVQHTDRITEIKTSISEWRAKNVTLYKQYVFPVSQVVLSGIDGICRVQADNQLRSAPGNYIDKPACTGPEFYNRLTAEVFFLPTNFRIEPYG
jgi:hypothetical protein